MRRYFCGEAAAKEEAAAAAEEAGADNGAHRLRFGEAGLSRGSKSRVRFNVAPQAMAGGERAGGCGDPGRAGYGGSVRGEGETAAAGPAQRRLPHRLGRMAGGELRQGLRLLPIALSRERLRPPRRLLRRRIRSPPAPPPRIPPPAVPGAVAGTVGAELGSARRLGAADEERWRRRFPL